MKRLIISFIISYCASAQAADLGRYGSTFPITEPDLLQQIESQLNHYQKNGKLDQFNQQYLEEFKKQVTNPHKITGITKSEKETFREFDPTTELEEDILIPEGEGQKILYAKGTKINPLDYMKFDEPLIFIDGEDEYQINFAHDYFDKNKRAKIILINGKPGLKEIQNNESQNKEYYHFFDQWGAYSMRFSINKVPSVVFQREDAKSLTIWEMKLP